MKNKEESLSTIKIKKGVKGITLIALVVTIIVLIVLTGVAVNLTIGSNGIFMRAQNAVDIYKIAESEEQDESNKAVNFLDDYMNGGDGSDSEDDNPNIPTDEIPDELERYILGEDKTGRSLFDIYNSSDCSFKQDPNDPNSTIHEKVKLAYRLNEGISDYCIRYNREVYKISLQYGILTTKLEKINTPKGNLGKYVQYKGMTWIVLREDTSKVELISANAIESDLIDFSSYDVDTARTAYNNAIDNFIAACKNETGITENIRNVGGPEIDTTTDTVIFSNLETFTPNEGVTFNQYEGETNGLKVGDENYLDDYNQMKNLGLLTADNANNYWMSSRRVGVTNSSNGIDYVNFIIESIGGDGLHSGGSPIVIVNSRGVAESGIQTIKCIRPIISLGAGALNSATATGNIDDPIIL